MQNFGRGMWRRVGDYDRVQKPMLLQQERIEQWKQFIEYQTLIKRQKQIKEYREQILKKVNLDQPKEVTDTKTDNIIVSEVKDMTEEQSVSLQQVGCEEHNNIPESSESEIKTELIKITPKKIKKKKNVTIEP